LNAATPSSRSPVEPISADEHDFDEQAVIERCRAQDAGAWKRLYDRAFPFVWRVAWRLGAPESELDDVCQEVFVVAFRKLPDFEGGRFTTWLYRIVANEVAGRVRKNRLRSVLRSLWGAGEPALAPAPDSAYELKEAQRALQAVLVRLAPKKREVFVLADLEGLSSDEVAERVGCPAETARTRLFHARKDFERIARKRGYIP
jgi:RNA polymerase sigma-70 factor (ECF subfamily)